MSRIELPVSQTTAALVYIRIILILLGPAALWMFCILLTADTAPPTEVTVCKIGLPLVIVIFIVGLIWSNRVARAEAKPRPRDY